MKSTKNTDIQPLESDLQFKYQKVEEKITLMNISDILKEKRDHDLVSVVAFISRKDRPVVSTTLRSGDVMDKLEVPINDKTGLINLTLWGPNIPLVQQDGVYQIAHAKVREWPRGVLVLNTTTANSNILHSRCPNFSIQVKFTRVILKNSKNFLHQQFIVFKFKKFVQIVNSSPRVVVNCLNAHPVDPRCLPVN